MNELRYSYKTNSFLYYEDSIDVKFSLLKFLLPFIEKEHIQLPNDNLESDDNYKYLKNYLDKNYNYDIEDLEKDAKEFVINAIYSTVDTENFHMYLLKDIAEIENLSITDSCMNSSNIYIKVKTTILNYLIDIVDIKELERILSNAQIHGIEKLNQNLQFNYNNIKIDNIDIISFIDYAKITIIH